MFRRTFTKTAKQMAMLASTAVNLEKKHPTTPQVMSGGSADAGVPFYGNLYQGRVNGDDYSPRGAGNRPKHLDDILKGRPVFSDDDPVVKAKLDKCPYFGLCDLVVWQGMDPQYLDPGVLTLEEHQLLLLHSRAYYEKWKQIHEIPREILPRLRIKKGRAQLTNDIMEMLAVSSTIQENLDGLFFDDSCLIAMQPNCWSTANLEPDLRDQFTGKVLEKAGMGQYQRIRLFELLNKMRTIILVRKDGQYADLPYEERLVIPFRGARTLHDLYSKLDLQPYSGQLKVYNYLDAKGTRLTVTLNDEDTYFDFLLQSFYGANIRIFDTDSCNRFTIVVEDETRDQRLQGAWF